jgi:hypothetical protein
MALGGGRCTTPNIVFEELLEAAPNNQTLALN